MSVPLPAAASHVPPVSVEEPERRASRRRGERVRMLQMTFASYVVDAILLTLLHLAGAVQAGPVIFYAVAGTTACLVFFLALRGGWSERFSDPYLTGAQMIAASALQLVTAWLAPPIGVLSLTIVFLVFAFSALRLTRRQLLPQWILISVGIALVLGTASRPLALPTDTPWQTVLSAIWLSLAIGRCAFVGLYGASVRHLLGTRNRQLADARDALHMLASRDELTGALNRRAIMELLRTSLHEAADSAEMPAVALLDLDHFKQVNDVHGHLVGDEVLRRFVRAAVGVLRGKDRLGRYGGEEFLLIAAAPTEQAARQMAERVRAAVAEEDWSAVAPGLQVTVSIGLAHGRRGESAEALLQRIDDALYAAKSQGRDRVVVG
jgi:diguanylate cyclase (GGDEF)-like protein